MKKQLWKRPLSHITALVLACLGSTLAVSGTQFAEGNDRSVNPDGSPEFPDRVIGRWSARGWHVGNGGKTTQGPWVVTTQIFDLGPEVGVRSIVTDGYETPEINKPIRRAITGGTGKYVAAKGEQTQWMLRFPNPTFGLNARIELKIHNEDRR